jgi:RNA polymerase-binding protein DksA
MLTEQQLADLKQALQDRLQQLRIEIRDELLQADDQTYVALAGQVHDRQEESFADLLVDINLADIDRHIAEVREVEAALGRLQDGDYGDCADCGEAIALERLQVQPAARRCMACQRNFEHTHAGGAGRSL